MRFGISDNLATNVFAQAGKCRVPNHRLCLRYCARAGDAGAQGMVKVYPRRIDLETPIDSRILKRRRWWRVWRRSARRSSDVGASLPSMSERLLFLTGHLALPRLERMLAGFGDTARGWRIHDIGVKVAALMTQEIILRRLPRPVEAERVILPGRCRADLAALTRSSAFHSSAGRRNRRSTCLFGARGNEPISRASTCASSRRLSTPRR